MCATPKKMATRRPPRGATRVALRVEKGARGRRSVRVNALARLAAQAAGGHIRRARDAQDERRVRIALTPQGLGLRDQAERIPHCVLESSQCTLPELVALTSQLKTLRERLSQR